MLVEFLLGRLNTCSEVAHRMFHASSTKKRKKTVSVSKPVQFFLRLSGLRKGYSSEDIEDSARLLWKAGLTATKASVLIVWNLVQQSVRTLDCLWKL